MDTTTEFTVLLVDPSNPETCHYPPYSTSPSPLPLPRKQQPQLQHQQHLSIPHSPSSPSSLAVPPRSKSPIHQKPRSRSGSGSALLNDHHHATAALIAALCQAGLQVLTVGSSMAALSFLSHKNAESRPTIFLIDLDPEYNATSTHLQQNGITGSRHRRQQRGGRYGSSPRTKSAEQDVGNNHNYTNSNHSSFKSSRQQQQHLSQGSATSPSSSVPSSPSYSPTRQQLPSPSRQSKEAAFSNHSMDDASDDDTQGRGFLATVLRKMAAGTLTNMVPIALVSSHTSQETILDIFNMGVADVLVKPVATETARTLFLSFHRYSLYKAASTIPRYASQKYSSLALPSHARLRNVFLKDQWLSDILINHYCPPQQVKINISEFPSMTTAAALERCKHLRKRLLSWDFHPHDLCQEDLMRCVIIVFEEVMKLDDLGDLNIPEHLLHRFVIGLRDSYHRSNPYHNFAHAVDVLQATFYFLCRMGMLPKTGRGFPPMMDSESSSCDEDLENKQEQKKIRVHDYMRAEDIFALVVASIGHDVGHPGVNNMFLVNAHTPLAQVYNDRSVLESFHSMALFQVMKKHGFECFDVDSQNRKFMEFRKMVVSTILATDMGLHFDYVNKIKDQVSRLRARNEDPQAPHNKMPPANIVEQERLVLCGTLIKCADISNASRPFHVAERWSTVLLQEMCNQADIEKEMAICSGQPVAPGSTKSLANDRGMQIDSQLGFIHGFAMPLFANVAELITEMEYCVDLLKKNHKIWEDRKAEYLKNGGPALTMVQHKVEVSKPLGKSPSANVTTNGSKVHSNHYHHHQQQQHHSSHHHHHHHERNERHERQSSSRREQYSQSPQPRPPRSNGKMRTLTGGYEPPSSRGGSSGGNGGASPLFDRDFDTPRGWPSSKAAHHHSQEKQQLQQLQQPRHNRGSDHALPNNNGTNGHGRTRAITSSGGRILHKTPTTRA